MAFFTIHLLKSFLCVQIVVACCVISVNGYNRNDEYSVSPRHSGYGPNVPIKANYSSNYYINVWYNVLDATEKEDLSHDLPDNDQVKQYLEYGVTKYCYDYGAVGAIITYFSKSVKNTKSHSHIHGFMCIGPNVRVEEGGEYVVSVDDDNDLLLLTGHANYMDDLIKEVDGNYCKEISSMDVYYIRPSVSRSGKGEAYFGTPSCFK